MLFQYAQLLPNESNLKDYKESSEEVMTQLLLTLQAAAEAGLLPTKELLPSDILISEHATTIDLVRYLARNFRCTEELLSQPGCHCTWLQDFVATVSRTLMPDASALHSCLRDTSMSVQDFLTWALNTVSSNNQLAERITPKLNNPASRKVTFRDYCYGAGWLTTNGEPASSMRQLEVFTANWPHVDNMSKSRSRMPTLTPSSLKR